ncbi:AAA family ATPase [Acinetobacter higginsii]|uniref:AAA family ATPase n=1 Tax=Acinetobacter higginsii TaxID=70347 RepID=UPI001F4B475C|nr:ATP-binding protein [Acinetobacter higginsii]MCH7338427.1 ATP-binding protein [Acinetobacter higginsii]
MYIKDFYFREKLVPLVIPEMINNDSNCYSILIGKNGIGKSSLLAEIILSQMKYATLPYNFDFNNYDTPPNIIAISTSPFDQFPNSRTLSKEKNYKYIGMKDSPTNVSAINLLSSAIKSIFDQKVNNISHDKLIEVFKEINIYPLLKIIIRPNFKRIKDLTESGISAYKISRLNQSETDPIADYLEITLNHQIINRRLDKEAIIENLDEIKHALEITKELFKDYTPKSVPLDFTDEFLESFNKNNSILYEKILLKSINTLLKFDLLRIIDIKIDKNEFGEMSLRRASSGEQCIISLILGIAGNIKDNSLIFIDEPEISLHPKWQEYFMPLLMKVFNSYKGCHFFISTHSPQIISNLKSENCFVISLTENLIFPADEFNNMSSDFQLAELFKSPGIKNEYISRLAFSLLSKLKTVQKFDREIIKDLEKLVSFKKHLKDNDPTNELIDTVKEVYNFYASN